MGVIATAVRHLITAGVTGEALVLAIAEMEAEAPVDRAAENRRAYDRERKRLEREAQKSGGNPVESADNAEQKALDKKPPHTPQKINPKKSPPLSPPSWVPAVEWAAFEEMRQRIRKPLTDRARELAIGELAKLREAGHAPADVLNWAVMNSYQGLFPPPANRARAGPEPVIGI